MSPLTLNLTLIALQLTLLVPLLLPAQRRWAIAQRVFIWHLFGAAAIAAVPTAFALDAVTAPLNMLIWMLVLLIGWVVLRFARRNLAGDPDRQRFLAAYLFTLTATTITITSHHILVFALGWIMISVGLHRLLLFYPHRARAKLAAHKKFLFSRVAEITLIAALGLLFWQHQSFDISVILAHYHADTTLQPREQLAAILLAVTALTCCAQLPLHGWLIQIVEAPTPVSALLHAGIINLGGFLLLSFSPLLALALSAQWLLLIVAGISCVLAALIMMTRISVKVRLAWSTVAQMGLMLIEIALGLYELATLHLIAHSCYKANAFLNSGNAVQEHSRQALTAIKRPQLSHWLLAAALVGAGGYSATLIFTVPSVLSPWLLLAFALTTLAAQNLAQKSLAASVRLLGQISVALALYWLAKVILQALQPTTTASAPVGADSVVMLLFSFLMGAVLLIQYWPHQALIKRLWIALNAGLYLDEWSTRLTLACWPTDIPHSINKQLNGQRPKTSGQLEIRYE
ncbi:MAG: NADH-quinone oxidoreductase subunit L [Gammaproteobacteria bacterium]|nr:NADH-quinone oxidoreductase subunit L [Gammaproteobacteria bacterium]